MSSVLPERIRRAKCREFGHAGRNSMIFTAPGERGAQNTGSRLPISGHGALAARVRMGLVFRSGSYIMKMCGEKIKKFARKPLSPEIFGAIYKCREAGRDKCFKGEYTTMAKIVFSDLPMKKELHAFRYVADGQASMQYEGEVIFPVNSVLAKSLKKGEKVKVVLLSKDDPEANSKTNEKVFRAELDQINESVGAVITYVDIMTPFVETRSVHEEILRAVIGEIEEKAEIIADVTYGPKTLPMIMLMALNFAERYFGCRICNVVYGKVNFVDDGSGTGKTKPINPVLYDLAPLCYLNSVINLLECKTPGDALKALDILLKM